MTPRDPAHDRRQRRLLVALALLFFAPLGASFYLYYGPIGWRPGSHVNHGDLIDPPRPLPAVALPLASRDATRDATRDAARDAARDAVPGDLKTDLLRNKWTLLYVGSGACQAVCRKDLYNTRQVRIALNRDMDRVQRVFIADGTCCDWAYLDAEHPDLITVRAVPAAGAVLRLLPSYGGIPPLSAERLYLVDPLGNLMMSFAPDAPPKGMLTDLKRLLGLSHVG